jgi:hypothetical protein
MTAYLRPRSGDPAEVGTPPAVQVTVDGRSVTALAGQTVAAVLLTQGRTSWRTTRLTARPRGTFCGIGACHDCLIIVNGTPDIRACQRTIRDGDAITSQRGAVLPDPADPKSEQSPKSPAQARPQPEDPQLLVPNQPQRPTSDEAQRSTPQPPQVAVGFPS